MLKFLLIPFCAFISAMAGDIKPGPVSKDSMQKQPVLYVFEGSDWCANCRRLEKSILSDSVFLSWLDSHHIRMEILDFPQRKKQDAQTVSYNRSMSERLEFKGDFPTLVICSSKSGRFTALQYRNQTVAEFSALLMNELKKLDE